MNVTSEAAVLAPVRARLAERFYYPELDTLRFFAFFAVFLFHAFPREAQRYHSLGLPDWLLTPVLRALVAGSFGVDLFFALSAYLITTLLLRERAVAGEVDLRSFYVRRILRIWPLYLSFVVVAALLPFVTHGPQLGLKYIAGYSLLAGNWAYVLYGLPASVARPLWTVSIEEQFYLTWPLAFRRASVAGMVKMALAILLFANLCRVLIAAMGGTVLAMEYSTFTRLDPIALGILIALLGSRLPPFSRWQRAALLSTGLVILIAISVFYLPDLSGPPTLWQLAIALPLTALASAAMLVAVIGSQHPFLRHKWLVYLGKISYGLYVVHSFALSGAVRLIHASTALTIVIQGGVGLILAILLAAASYRWLERPFLELKKRFSYVESRPV